MQAVSTFQRCGFVLAVSMLLAAAAAAPAGATSSIDWEPCGDDGPREAGVAPSEETMATSEAC
jgi:hypothetical protein